MDDPGEAGLRLAGRLLAQRDLSRDRLRERLTAAAIPPEAAERVVADLERAGYVDDGRLARARAQRLAERGWGDSAIAERLRHDGVGAGHVEAALAALSPEHDRARQLAESCRAFDARRFLARLERRGFGEDALDAAASALDGGHGSKLR